MSWVDSILTLLAASLTCSLLTGHFIAKVDESPQDPDHETWLYGQFVHPLHVSTRRAHSPRPGVHRETGAGERTDP